MNTINPNDELNVDDKSNEWNWSLDDELEECSKDDDFSTVESSSNELLENDFSDEDEGDNFLENENQLNFDKELLDNSELKKEQPLFEESELESEVEAEEERLVAISPNKLILLLQLVNNVNENISRINELVSPLIVDKKLSRIAIGQIADGGENLSDVNEGKALVIEGVYDGENMIGPDGKKYSMPVNYASKSKLVEGDIMKLTILSNGTFVYKQIAPIDRLRVVGELKKSGDGYVVVSGDNQWRILNASVTYYRGQEGDEVIILVPAYGGSNWAAVDNIIKK